MELKDTLMESSMDRLLKYFHDKWLHDLFFYISEIDLLDSASKSMPSDLFIWADSPCLSQ